eukprot:7391196-Prymnesium_polylepis.1
MSAAVRGKVTRCEVHKAGSVSSCATADSCYVKSQPNSAAAVGAGLASRVGCRLASPRRSACAEAANRIASTSSHYSEHRSVP